jgi:hypothetical protein
VYVHQEREASVKQNEKNTQTSCIRLFTDGFERTSEEKMKVKQTGGNNNTVAGGITLTLDRYFFVDGVLQ